MRSSGAARGLRWAGLLFSIAVHAGGGLCCPLLGQVCERTVVVGLGGNLDPDDFEAKLDKKPLTISSVEPVRSRRILVLVDVSDWQIFPKQFQKRMELIARYTTNVPSDTEVAYGLFALEVEFSPFTADPVEMRHNLEGLVARATSGALGNVSGVLPAFFAGISYLEYPVVRTTSDSTGLPSLGTRPKDLPLNGTRPGDMIVMVPEFVAGVLSERDRAELEARLFKDNVRLYLVIPSDYPNAESPGQGQLGWFARKTGGDSGYDLESSGWLWSYGFGSASTLKVQVPLEATGGRWSLKLSPSGARRLGFPKGSTFGYPDLLLCGTTAKGGALIAARP